MGAFAGLDEEVGGDVDAGDDGSVTGERDGGVAGAAGDVEDAGAGRDGEAADEGFGAAGDGFGDDAEVAGHPGGAHGGFDLLDGVARRCSCVASAELLWWEKDA